MKILFIENRHKTRFYNSIAEGLSSTNMKVSWIVQNHMFKPKIGDVYQIPYPKKKQLNWKDTPEYVQKIMESDRQLNFFGKEDFDYFNYYSKKIEEIILKLNPDYVFGEATVFHELIAVEVCKIKGIPYLNPSTCRYPTGRFSFYKYDSLEPYLGSGESLSDEKAIEIISNIVEKKVKPDYMRKISTPKFKTLYDKVIKAFGFYFGEKFNTPNPRVKYLLEKKKKINISTWEKDAIHSISDDETFKILYPLQMQPEANIDVWGRKWRDQTGLMSEIITLLPKNTKLFVKPNPKSKYELSEELIELCSKNPKIVAISHDMGMGEVFPKMDMVITVTGTIAMECIFSNKPVLTLAKTLNNRQKNCIYIDKLEEINTYVEMVMDKTFPTISERDKIAFINYLNQTSYSGEINDPYSSPLSIQNSNIEKISDAFLKTINA